MRSSWLIVFLIWQMSGTSQSKLVRLPDPINHPSINVSSPFVSLDGNSLLFLSDNAEDNVLTIFFSSKPDGVNWKEPVPLPRTINNRVNHLRGFALSPDGRQLFITTTKGGGLGGYDLYSCDQRGAFWSDPVNIGLPLNSKEHDGSPSISTEGTMIFFMRCERMDANKADGCRILMSTRKTLTSQWTMPVELPARINTGNSQSPRIMGDGETLIFSSNKFSGKGGMELLLTRRTGEEWSNPVLLDFVNTETDDQFVSATSLGRYLMKDAPGKRTSEIVEVLFPPELKPKGVMKLEGKVQTPENPGSAYINVYDKNSRARLLSTRPSKEGVFTLYLKEGSVYELTADPEKDNFTFFSHDFDLSQGKINTMERIDVPLKPVAPGDAIDLANVGFKPYSTELVATSQPELGKVLRLINSNPSMKFTIEVSLFGYEKDSVLSNPELTESDTDSIHFTITKTFTDSIGNVSTESRDSVVVKTTYHNDRSDLQALEVVNYLIEQGVPSANLMPSNRVFAVVPEERKTMVRVIARQR